jgi:hypothetical protein
VITGTKRESQALVKPLKGAKKSTTTAIPKAPKVSKMKAQPEKTTKASKPTMRGLVSTPASDILTLPEFAREKWSSHFLPTLYDCLGCSREPFTISADVIHPVQAVVNAAYPDSEYTVVANDKIISMVCKHLLICTSADGRRAHVQAKSRLNEKRAFFGREAIKIVTDFFNGNNYANKPNAIAKFAKWAIRGNGPALFGKPTPIGCVRLKGSDGYIVRFLHHLYVPLTSVNDDF